MSKAKKSTGVSKPSCPLCRAEFTAYNPGAAKAPQSDLRLDSGKGLYVCQAGHEMTGEALQAALKEPPKQLSTEPKGADASAAVPAPSGSGEKAPETEPETGIQGAGLETDSGTGIVPEVVQDGPDLGGDLDHAEDKTGDFEAVINPAESSETQDDVEIDTLEAKLLREMLVKELPLSNGDLAVWVVIPEGLVGPVEELAGEMQQPVHEWLSGNIELYLNDLFQRR